MDILTQIKDEILDDSVSLSSILRKARILASELQSEELAGWVKHELGGYPNENSLPDYRWIKTSVVGTWTNGFYSLSGRGIQLSKIDDEDLVKHLTEFTVFEGIQKIIENTKLQKNEHFLVQPDVIAYVNLKVGENGYGYSQLFYTVRPSDFLQILESIRNRLLEFILLLGERWEPQNAPPTKSELEKMISINIYNNPKIYEANEIDQRGQTIISQDNSIGDISIESLDSLSDVIPVLRNINSQIKNLSDADLIPEIVALEIETQLGSAVKEMTKSSPNKKSVGEILEDASKIMKPFVSLANLMHALLKISEFLKGM